MNERRFGTHVVKLTRPDKVLFPDDAIQKQEIALATAEHAAARPDSTHTAFQIV